MFKGTRFLQFLFLLIAIISIFGASQLLPKIIQQRHEYQLTQNRPLENAPPQLVVATTALGSLRSFLIDYLWLRATELRNKGNHYEIVQLYDWIGKLEPRIPEVWSFIAWEMCYNISVSITNPEDRWRWLYKGISQLRDYGIQYNQNTSQLYWELGFTIYNKITSTAVDDHRFYYQLRWFEMWHDVVGSNPDFVRWSAYPNNWNEFAKQEPQVAQLVQEINAYVNKDAMTSFNILEDFSQIKNFPDIQKKVEEICRKTEYQESNLKLFGFIVCQRLRQEFKMDPKMMAALQQKYGELDWRLPGTHCLYWAEEGKLALERAKQTHSSRYTSESATIYEHNLDRLHHLALQDIFDSGKFLAITSHRVVCLPNFAVLEPLHQLHEEIQKKWGLEKGRESHEEFLRRAIKKCYMYNQRDQAQKYYQILGSKFSRPDYQQKLDDFVIQDIGKIVNFGERHHVEAYIIETQVEAYRSLLSGDPDHYQGLEAFAKMIHRRYTQRINISDQINAFEQVQPIEYFQKAAVAILRQNLIATRGAAQAEKIWQQIEERFPMFIKLRSQ